MCTGHQSICAVWADVSIVMDHSSVLKPTLQSVLVWPAPWSQPKPHQTQLHVVPFCHNSKSLRPVALLSQEHKDFSAWFTVCEWLWTGPHAVLWCIVCVCVCVRWRSTFMFCLCGFGVMQLWVCMQGFLSSTDVMMSCCSEVCGCVLHAATWVGGILCKRTLSGGALKQKALTVLWTH